MTFLLPSVMPMSLQCPCKLAGILPPIIDGSVYHQSINQC
jgi:hypothetical protein